MAEVFIPLFRTTLTTTISSGVRPTTFSVASTQAVLGAGGATFSALIFDIGTDANPTHAEALKITSGGGTLTWTGTNEAEWTPTTHASGSQVIVTVLTPRSMQQPLVDHITPATTPDPHTQYIRGATFTNKGDSLVGLGAGSYTSEAVGVDGTTLIADSTQSTGRRWGNGTIAFLTHMGDLVVGGVLGLAARMGIGTIGQALTVVQKTATVTDPISGPICTAGATGGSLGNGSSYDFVFAWNNGSSPDGGTTLPSPITSFVATSTGRVNVQAPAAPSTGLTLLVYAGASGGSLYLSTTTLPNASTSGTNTITISVLPVNTQPIPVVTNTTGGVGPAWTTLAGTGTVTSVSLSVPAEFSSSGSPISSSGTLAITKKTQNANTFWGGPQDGAAVLPVFRHLVAADIPVVFAHEEFMPANTTTQFDLAHVPITVLIVSRNGVIQSVVDGHYSVTGPTLVFTSAFNGSERIVVAYSHDVDQSLFVIPGKISLDLPPRIIRRTDIYSASHTHTNTP